MAKKKTKRYKAPSFPHFLRVAFILFIAVMIIYAYYLSTEGDLLKQIKAFSLLSYHSVIRLVKKYPSILIGLASYGVVFYLGYFIGKKH